MATDNELAAHVREQLRPFLQRRVEFEGTVGRFSSIWDYKERREVPSVLVRNVEIREGDHPVIDHVFVTFAILLQQSGARPGDVVRFTAQVYSYQHRDPDDHNKVTTRLGLREPRDIKGMNRDLMPSGGDGDEEEERVRVPIPGRNGVDVDEALRLEVPPPPPAAPAKPADPKRRLLDAVWSLVEEHGLDRVKKTLSAVEALQE